MGTVEQPCIREAKAADEAALLTLATEFATSFDVMPEDFTRVFAELLETRSACLLAAEADGRVVGYALAFAHPAFYANGRVVWVEEIAVQSDFRRQGIGRRLMQEIEGWAEKHQCRLIALATRRAAAFYEALGYEASAAYYRKRL